MQKVTLNRFTVKKGKKEKHQYGGKEKPKEKFKGQYSKTIR